AADGRAQSLFRRRELPGNQRVDRAAYVVLQCVPLPAAQNLQLEDLRVEPILQDAVVDRVLGRGLFRVDVRQLRQATFRGGQLALHSLRAVVVEARVVAVLAEPGRRFRIAIEQLLEILLRERFEASIVGSGSGSQQEGAEEQVHGGALYPLRSDSA